MGSEMCIRDSEDIVKDLGSEHVRIEKSGRKEVLISIFLYDSKAVKSVIAALSKSWWRRIHIGR